MRIARPGAGQYARLISATLIKCTAPAPVQKKRHCRRQESAYKAFIVGPVPLRLRPGQDAIAGAYAQWITNPMYYLASAIAIDLILTLIDYLRVPEWRTIGSTSYD
jgi:hypothetical protein